MHSGCSMFLRHKDMTKCEVLATGTPADTERLGPFRRAMSVLPCSAALVQQHHTCSSHTMLPPHNMVTHAANQKVRPRRLQRKALKLATACNREHVLQKARPKMQSKTNHTHC